MALLLNEHQVTLMSVSCKRILISVISIMRIFCTLIPGLMFMCGNIVCELEMLMSELQYKVYISEDTNVMMLSCCFDVYVKYT